MWEQTTITTPGLMSRIFGGSGLSGLSGAVLKNPPHPYYPLGVEIVGYLANEQSVLELLGVFAAGCVVVLGGAALLAKRARSSLTATEILTIMWFVLCGFIHFFFEGYFAYNHKSMGGRQDIFGQLWKEYAKSDSRYLTQDPFVLCMETITAICWGPTSFALAYMITVDHPLRHPLQIIVSLGQIYGDVLYYATSLFDHYAFSKSYSRPEAYYYWGYYVLMNAFWIVFPTILLYSSVVAIGRAFEAIQKAEASLNKAKANGDVATTNGAARRGVGAAKR